MAALFAELRKNPSNNVTIILDGGLGSELERQGADLSGKLWSARYRYLYHCIIYRLDHANSIYEFATRLLRDEPDLIYRTHKAYFVAGADVATTASYQATVKGFQELGLDTLTAEDLIRSSVRLAKKARDDFWNEYQISSDGGERQQPLVAASIGSYGASLADGSEFNGNFRSTATLEGLKDFHRSRMLLLAREGADILACETVRASFLDAPSGALACLARPAPVARSRDPNAAVNPALRASAIHDPGDPDSTQQTRSACRTRQKHAPRERILHTKAFISPALYTPRRRFRASWRPPPSPSCSRSRSSRRSSPPCTIRSAIPR